MGMVRRYSHSYIRFMWWSVFFLLICLGVQSIYIYRISRAVSYQRDKNYVNNAQCVYSVVEAIKSCDKSNIE